MDPPANRASENVIGSKAEEEKYSEEEEPDHEKGYNQNTNKVTTKSAKQCHRVKRKQLELQRELENATKILPKRPHKVQNSHHALPTVVS